MLSAELLLDMARGLAAAETSGEYLLAAACLIERLFGCEDVFWMSTDFSLSRFDVWRLHAHGTDACIESAMAGMFAHPAIQSYLARPSDLSPRRLTDLGHADDADEALALSRHLMGTHQLSMILHVDPARSGGRGWVLTRDGHDFTPADRETAAQLLPILLALDRAHCTAPKASGPFGPRCPADAPDPTDAHRPHRDAPPGDGGWAALTPRERQVVDLLTLGHTARAIGHRLGISPRTVSKHVQHAYEKLGHHDRLVIALERPVLFTPSTLREEQPRTAPAPSG